MEQIDTFSFLVGAGIGAVVGSLIAIAIDVPRQRRINRHMKHLQRRMDQLGRSP